MSRIKTKIADVTFRVSCSCGQPLTGTRQAVFQIVRCPACGAERFILPRSPLPPVDESKKLPATGGGESPSQRKVFLYPALAVVLTASGLVALYLMFLAPGPEPDVAKNMIVKPAAERLTLAERFLGEGKFRLAADELAADVNVSEAAERRRWRQVQREAALLADLLAEPIEDIVRHAAGVAELEWQADFPRRYQGKAVIFDVMVQLENGSPRATYAVTGPNAFRLELRELRLLSALDLDRPRRLIFGARLGQVSLEPPGPIWVVRFQPDSGVLLTEPRAAALCCPPLGDDEAVRTLEEQKQITSSLP